MSLKLFAPAGNFRTNAVLVAADAAGVAVELVHTDYSETKTAEFKAKNPLGKVPALQTESGPLYETAAILRHIARTSGKLYGATAYESSLVDQYLDVNNTELFPALLTLVLPYFGLRIVDKEVLKTARIESIAVLKVLDERVKNSPYLAGAALTIADIHLASVLTLAFRVAFSDDHRKAFKNLTEYFLRVANEPAFVRHWGKPHLSATVFEIPAAAEKKEAPKKEAPKKDAPKKEAPKAAEAKKEEAPVEEEAPAGEAKWNLYDFKTLYTNAKDKNTAIDNLVENFNPATMSVFHLHYQKYEGEGTIVYQFNNMKNGFIQRCEAARKKAFGTYSIYGDEPNLEISGVWLFDSADVPAEMHENPSFEYHDKRKLDLTNADDLQLLRDNWTKIVDDESVVGGLTLRAFGSFKWFIVSPLSLCLFVITFLSTNCIFTEKLYIYIIQLGGLFVWLVG